MNGADEKEIRERAMNDPEVREILGDPIIRNILEQMEREPAAAREFVTFLLLFISKHKYFMEIKALIVCRFPLVLVNQLNNRLILI